MGLTIEFKDLAEGAEFVYNSVRYKKIAPMKVSCCQSLNAESTENSTKKIMVRPLEKIEIDE
jgi:hypothetical protein